MAVPLLLLWTLLSQTPLPHCHHHLTWELEVGHLAWLQKLQPVGHLAWPQELEVGRLAWLQALEVGHLAGLQELEVGHLAGLQELEVGHFALSQDELAVGLAD